MITPLKIWIAALDLPMPSKGVLHALADHSKNLVSWPSNKRLQNWTGAKERAVRAALRDLEARGLIVTERRDGELSRYRILFAASDTPARDAGGHEMPGGAVHRGDPAHDAAPPAGVAAPPAHPAAPPAQGAPELKDNLSSKGNSGGGSAAPAAPPAPAQSDAFGSDERSERKTKPQPVDPRGHRLPIDWRPCDADLAYAAERGLDPLKVAECFRDHWHAKPGKEGRKLDWSAAWRTWCREDQHRGKNLALPNVLPFGPKAVRLPAQIRPGKTDWLIDELKAGGMA